MAIPFMTGWWSKDQILLQVFYHNSYLFLLIYVAAIVTAAYSIKLFISAFTSLPRRSANVNPAGIGYYMLFGIILLSFFAVGLGYLTSSLYIQQDISDGIFIICMAVLSL
jgi:NADH:ubiquinone oxidoreductase subunit 5 (subunit L)/multisubunit Na+/H+ antiporter MnhA subunit